ncbi:hypothetical protein LSH36_268g03017 [Paralvinella palmiformis]|uniref:asparagine--tRNA ligase n=1 Tax=Paralvinella palmiformis TaxID=53620 RepID=A0AAD9N290_9ANNE|nr:hypothetical protein LSH36_268g03017 [Paralvinella palmiformis]
MKTVNAATYGSCIHAVGQLTPSQGRLQNLDLVAKSVEVLGRCNHMDFPFKMGMKHKMEYTRQYLHLRPKTNMFGCFLRLRNSLAQAIHNVLQTDGYVQVHTPILTSNDCEGAGEVFKVEPAETKVMQNLEEAGGKGKSKDHFFGVPTFLTVSGQLHLEAVTGSICKAYTFGPTFRAENSRSRHHLSEFYMLEAELAFADDLEDLMKVMECLIQKSISYILENNQDDLYWYWKFVSHSDCETIVKKMILKSFVRMTYTEAWGEDLQKEHERYLVRHCDGLPVFVTDFPTDIKPFYMKVNSNKRTVTVDLLLPEVGEVCGGSLRESNLDILEQKLESLGMSESLSWYLDLRRFGTCPHGGFGLGFERLLQVMLGIENIRDAIPFPRFVNSCKL